MDFEKNAICITTPKLATLGMSTRNPRSQEPEPKDPRELKSSRAHKQGIESTD
jgi:hypothetical protein